MGLLFWMLLVHLSSLVTATFRGVLQTFGCLMRFEIVNIPNFGDPLALNRWNYLDLPPTTYGTPATALMPPIIAGVPQSFVIVGNGGPSCGRLC